MITALFPTICLLGLKGALLLLTKDRLQARTRTECTLLRVWRGTWGGDVSVGEREEVLARRAKLSRREER